MDRKEFNELEYFDMVDSELLKHPNWRYGQALFNVLYALYPDLANELRGLDIDPFYMEDDFSEYYRWLDTL